MHTSQASRCGHSTGAQMAQFYKDKGYSGIVVTDHFFNGNTAIDQSLPWDVRVAQFCSGYEDAKRTGDAIGLHVFFGWEYKDRDAEFLTYGLDKQWLLSHPDLMQWSLKEYFDSVHRDGGFLIHAHPFRKADYLRGEFRLFPEDMDAVEIYNTAHKIKAGNETSDQQAYEYAAQYGLPGTSGSDYHNIEWEFPWGGMEFEQELVTIFDLIEAIKEESGTLFK